MVIKGLEEAITYCYKLLDLEGFHSLIGLIIGRIEAIIKGNR